MNIVLRVLLLSAQNNILLHDDPLVALGFLVKLTALAWLDASVKSPKLREGFPPYLGLLVNRLVKH